MSAKDFGGGYKRIVQYFWDPEPKNDDPSKGPIWCLGRCYVSGSTVIFGTTDTENLVSGETRVLANREENSACAPDSQQYVPFNPESKLSSRPHETQENDNGWPSEFLDDFESRIWLTYRSGFPAIQRSDQPNGTSSMTFTVRLRSQLVDQGGFSSDTGWGCMIRSGQSLFANALVTLRRGMHEHGEKEVLSLFADDPDAPFSIHRFVEHGALACGKHPGEWFGPSAAARCIKALAQRSVSNELKVYINGDGADVYQDQFFSLATAEGARFTPTLILVGIRLGIDRITPAYWEALKASLQLPQSVGIAGGRPSSSHYFVGVQGDNFFFLDPHQPRTALPWRVNVTDYTKEDVNSCHTRRLRRLPIHDMDPSMLIGFLIRDRDDWDLWRRSLSQVQGKPVVHVADKEPVMDREEARRQSTVYDVETLDDDEDDGYDDEGDGELV
ncbi:MAG: hypothetical protein Q9185_002071 [Variospora sp. 1 TL-2023]